MEIRVKVFQKELKEIIAVNPSPLNQFGKQMLMASGMTAGEVSRLRKFEQPQNKNALAKSVAPESPSLGKLRKSFSSDDGLNDYKRMIRMCLAKGGNRELLRKNLGLTEEEFEFWLKD